MCCWAMPARTSSGPTPTSTSSTVRRCCRRLKSTPPARLPSSGGKAHDKDKHDAETIPAGKETVLLAEDDATIRRMIKSTMEAEGYKLLEAEDGQEAIEISKSYDGDIHLLLTDVIMPKMNGRELANELQKDRPEMEVIFMSGYTDDAISHHGVLEPGVQFIQKPITPSVLAKKLREVLRK